MSSDYHQTLSPSLTPARSYTRGGAAGGNPRERVLVTTASESINSSPLDQISLPRIPAQCRTRQLLLRQSPLRELPPALLLTLPRLSATPTPRVLSVHLRVCSPSLYLTFACCHFLLYMSCSTSPRLLHPSASVLLGDGKST